MARTRRAGPASSASEARAWRTTSPSTRSSEGSSRRAGTPRSRQVWSAPLISAGRVFGFAAVVGAINSLLFAVAVTIAAFVYNVSADLVGGVEVTLSERD